MGCICSKGSFGSNEFAESANVKGLILHLEKSSGARSKKEEAVVEVGGARTHHGAAHRGLMQVAQPNVGLATNPSHADIKTAGVQRQPSTHVEVKSGQMPVSRVFSVPHGTSGEHVLAGWPSWLTSVAGEAIKGWVPRRAESFEKLDKIGQGTYSSVYKARDLETGKIVAMKKVRFVNMDPESVRFMAREIYILRKLDHPNVMKLEGLVISRMSCCLYLIFEYMDHDLAGLAASRSVKFTEPQIKCYMRQLLSGLEHCHSRGVLHRDIKGSNLLIDNNGVLKIGDFGLATLLRPDQSQPLTSHVVTLWYRAPELLLGAVKYGFGIDLWSTGCILAELYTGKPIMPGRTEVEQMHKIFKLCGSPSEDYWKRSKLTHATSFKPQHPYPRCITETFQNFPPSALALVDKLLAIEPEDRGSAAFALDSEFFKTKPLPCEPSSIPKYPPSKEFNVKVPDVATRKRADSVKGRGPESVRRGTITRGLRASKEVPTLDFNSQGQGQSNHGSGNGGYNGSGFPFEPTEKTLQTTSVIHPNSVQLSLTKKTDDANMGVGQPSSRTGVELRTQNCFRRPTQGTEELSKRRSRMDIIEPGREPAMGYVQKKNRINFSGPLLPPRDNMDDMLKEHEKQIQQAIRKSHINKFGTQKGYDQYKDYEILIQHIQNAG